MSTRKSLAWSFSQQFGQVGLQFVGSVIIARLLTPGEMGIFALALAVSFVLSTLRSFGIVTYLIREEELTEDKIRTAFGIMIVLGGVLGLILLLSRGFVAELYDEPGMADVLLLLAIGYFISPIGQPAQGLLSREMRFDLLHHITLAMTVVTLGTNIALALLGFSYMALAWGLLAGNVVQAVLLILAKPDHLKLTPSFSHWREVIRFGGYMTGIAIVGTFQSEGTKFLLGGFINPAAVALYDRAAQIPDLVRQSLFNPIARVFLPVFSKDIREGRSIGPGVLKLISANTVIVWPVFLSIGIISAPFIVLLFGENWRTAGEILPFLLIEGAIVASLPQPDQILIPHGRVKRLFKIRTTALVVNIVVTAVTASHSLELFANARPFMAMFFIALVIGSIHRYLSVDAKAVLREYGNSIVVALFCAPPALLFRLCGDQNLTILMLLGIIAGSAVLWLGGLIVTRNFLAGEILRSMKSGAKIFGLK